MRQQTFIAILFALIILPIGGCGTSSQERLEKLQASLKAYQDHSEDLDEQIATLEDSIQKAKELLGDPNLTGDSSSRIAAAIDEALSREQDLMAQKSRVDTVIQQVQDQITKVQSDGEVDWTDELSAAGTGLTAAGNAIGGGVGTWMTLAGTLLGLIAGAVPGLVSAVKASRKTFVAQKTTEKVVASINSVLDSGLVTDVEKAKELLAKRQGATVASAVKQIKEQ